MPLKAEKRKLADINHDDSQQEENVNKKSRNIFVDELPSSKKDINSKDKLDPDALSICVKNVVYSATEGDLLNAFIGCGDIARITIIKDLETGRPKGVAFIEFKDSDAIQAALLLNNKKIKGRKIKVEPKKPRPEIQPMDKQDDPSYRLDKVLIVEQTFTIKLKLFKYN